MIKLLCAQGYLGASLKDEKKEKSEEIYSFCW